MQLEQAFLVARREYVENLRTKTFWIGILAFPLMLVLMGVVPLLMSQVKDVRSYAVVDRSGFLAAEIEAEILQSDIEALLEGSARYRTEVQAFDRLPKPLRQATAAYLETAVEGREEYAVGLAQDRAFATWWQAVELQALEEVEAPLSRRQYKRLPAPDDETALNRMVESGELFAYFVIGPDPVEAAEGCLYVSKNLTDPALEGWYQGMASKLVRQRRVEKVQLDPQTAEWVHRSLRFTGRKVDTQGGSAAVDKADQAQQWAPVVFVYILWMAVMTSSQMLLTSTVEEKSSRIVEVLLSSVSPFELMVGKIAGMAASGLTVVGTWMLFGGVGIGVVPGLMGGNAAGLIGIVGQPLYLLSFVGYFLLGYLFYASLLVGVGSLCNDLKEAQNLIWPVILLLMVPLFAMIPISQDPNGTLARVLSFIPPFTPMVMMNRAAGPPALWEYGLTTLLLLAAIGAVVWGSARVFRAGILRSARPRWKEVVRWLAAEEE